MEPRIVSLHSPIIKEHNCQRVRNWVRHARRWALPLSEVRLRKKVGERTKERKALVNIEQRGGCAPELSRATVEPQPE